MIMEFLIILFHSCPKKRAAGVVVVAPVITGKWRVIIAKINLNFSPEFVYFPE